MSQGRKVWLIIKDWAFITLGTALVACAYVMLYVPNQVVPGGLSGIATLIYYITDFPIGVTVMLLNVPIFIIGWRHIGLTYIVRSLYSTVLLSVLIDVLPLPAITDNLLLAALFGGLVAGAGMGLVFRSFSSTGGVDIIAKVVNKFYPHLSLGRLIMMMDICVISVSAFKVGIEPALFAFIGVYVAQKATDYIIDGARSARAYYVVSKKYNSIAEKVMTHIDRGATLINVKGMYSGKDQAMLLCIIRHQEVGAFLQILHDEDPHAFVFVTNIHEVMGEGFSREHGEKQARLDGKTVLKDNESNGT